MTPQHTTKPKSVGVTDGKGEGIAKGAGGAALSWAGASLSTGEPITALVGLMFTPVAAVGGAIYGGVVSDKATDVTAQKAILDDNIATLPAVFDRQLTSELQAMNWLTHTLSVEQKHDSKLVVGPIELEATSNGPNNELSFTLTTHTKLTRVTGKTPLFQRTYKNHSRVEPLRDWTTNNGIEIAATIQVLAENTVAQILDDYFRRSALSVTPLYPVKKGFFRAPRLETTQPTFQWAVRDARNELDVEALSHFDGLQFDLRLIDQNGVIETIESLNDPSHTVKAPLAGCMNYRWTTRARYRSMQQSRTTSWSPEQRFRTPCNRKG
ncbi:MAG: hypothetical protein GKR90_08290 [Pseudomonadales bacterium]|nr:hypothetical protein [Pseudomonadales bacterium]